MESKCIICKQVISTSDGSAVISQKGADGINLAAEQRGDTPCAVPGNSIHTICRRDFCDKRRIDRHIQDQNREVASCSFKQSSKSLRSSSVAGNNVNNCIFCDQTVSFDDSHTKSEKCYKVRTIKLKFTLAEQCRNRNDEWGITVLGRLNAITSDLHAADSVYHNICSVNFRTGKNLPIRFLTEDYCNDRKPAKRTRLGRPADDIRLEAFFDAAQQFEESDYDQVTIADISNKMVELLEGTNLEPYGHQYLKQVLRQHYGDRVIISKSVITFRQTAEVILHDYYKLPQNQDPEVERINIIEASARLIKNEIKVVNTPKDEYYGLDDLNVDACVNFLPSSLRLLLYCILPADISSVIVAAIGQAIVQVSRPRAVIAPMQLGLGIQLHHHFSSRFLIDTLHHLGFCSNYNEIVKFERSAAISQTDIFSSISPDSFVQFVADNVDHDICTIDGKGTFHGMGIIATVTPASKKTHLNIPRMEVTSRDLKEAGSILFRFCPTLKSNTETTFINLPLDTTDDVYKNIDMLWYSSWFFHQNRPGWSGFMQSFHRGSHPGKAGIYFLPMIDHNPSDLSCVYSTLYYISQLASKHNISPVVTFDQPLYWKAVTIVNAEISTSVLKNLVLMLGGFHTKMSFLGCVGYIMQGTGLTEVIEEIYAGNTVKHIMSGHAVSRAMRAHSIVDLSLNLIFLSIVYDFSIDNTLSSAIYPEDIEVTRDTLERTLVDVIVIEDLALCEEINKLTAAVEHRKELMQANRTAKLWLQYMKMISILRRFITAERTGNFPLLLKTLAEMLPFFAAAGHSLYAKSVHLHLQNMIALEKQNQFVYSKFMEGLFVVRRSNRYWGGLAPDLVIEQSLMRSLKSTGGLTRGRGMTECQRSIWTLSMPICAQVNESMQDLAGLAYSSSEQHVESSSARMTKDKKDTDAVITFLEPLQPFGEQKQLRNIVTGMMASKSVNADSATDVGMAIISDMTGKSPFTYVFKRKEKCITMIAKQAVKIDNEKMHFDQALLFQRLSTIADRDCLNMQDVMSYELSTFPTALFKSPQVMREAHKPALADAILKVTKAVCNEYDMHYCVHVIDGGWLLQKIPWESKSSYDSICCSYVTYVTSHFGKADVIFDGYIAGPSTKDMVHLRRTKGLECPTIEFNIAMTLSKKKEEFLRNPFNKQRIISYISQKLIEAGCLVQIASADADVLIAKTAICRAQTATTCLVGNDTDLLILLLHHCPAELHNLYFRTESRIWDIKLTKHELQESCQHLLFAHAFLGCDTTSTLFGIGKQKALSLIRSDDKFCEASDVFCRQHSTKEEIEAAGEKAILRVYKAKSNESLISLRIRLFHLKVASSTSFVKPETLPPTPAAALYHYYRVYLQIMEWQGFEGLMAEEWGWRNDEGICVPVMTNKKPAPSSLLSMTRCNCTTGCETMRCSCKKNGLQCTTACGECMGSQCGNCSVIESDDDSS